MENILYELENRCSDYPGQDENVKYCHDIAGMMDDIILRKRCSEDRGDCAI